MLTLLVLLVSSLIIDDGVLRSSFNGLQILCGGLDAVCGSNDKSSESIEPFEPKKMKKGNIKLLYWNLAAGLANFS